MESKSVEILAMRRYSEEDDAPTDYLQHAIFRLKDQVLMAIDNVNGMDIEMNPAMSLYVTVKDTMEMERLFNGLKNEGAILMPKTEMPPFREFAWVQDKFGVSFQLALPENK
ncbi:MAG: hypothetical protein DI572_07875 [Staphylococcus epidermidis]|nr:MAG: hypothetical protein DI572_07875 [Staphylococcus epidermidis]